MKPVIRAATLADAAVLAELATQLGYPSSAQEMRLRLTALIEAARDVVLVAEEQGRVCGWLQAHGADTLESGFRVEIVGLVVDASLRRSGVGRLLVERAETWARELGSELVVVRSNVQRTESHSFYPALGYVKAKVQAVYRKRLV